MSSREKLGWVALICVMALTWPAQAADWIRTYDHDDESEEDDAAVASIVDLDGNIYVLGTGIPGEDGDQDVVVLMYPPDGGGSDPLFVWKYDTVGDQQPVAFVRSNATGEIYVAAQTLDASDVDDYLTLKFLPYDPQQPNPTPAWALTCGYPVGSHGSPSGIALYPKGGLTTEWVVVAGTREGEGLAESDWYMVRYSRNGLTSNGWAFDYDPNRASGHRDDIANAVTVDQDGDIYVTGKTCAFDDPDWYEGFCTAKFLSNGTRDWCKITEYAEFGDGDATEIATFQNWVFVSGALESYPYQGDEIGALLTARYDVQDRQQQFPDKYEVFKDIVGGEGYDVELVDAAADDVTEDLYLV